IRWSRRLETPLESETDPLAEPPKPEYQTSLRAADRWFRRADQEGIRHPHTFERLIEHPRRERFQVQRDVGKFGHSALLYPTAELCEVGCRRRAHQGTRLALETVMIDDLWYKNAVIYCLDVEKYVDGNGDGVGDFEGLTRRLDYLA